jgi:hypothetical protein
MTGPNRDEKPCFRALSQNPVQKIATIPSAPRRRQATIYAGRPISAPAVAKPQHYGSLRTSTKRSRAESDTNHVRCRGAKSFVDDLGHSRGVVLRAINRLRLNVSKIIPGDWGKVGPGWLARLLQDRIERLGGGGRIHQFLWRRSRVVSKREKGTAR